LSDRERDEIDLRGRMILRRCKERLYDLERAEKGTSILTILGATTRIRTDSGSTTSSEGTTVETSNPPPISSTINRPIRTIDQSTPIICPLDLE
jgi:hypothetical protein